MDKINAYGKFIVGGLIIIVIVIISLVLVERQNIPAPGAIANPAGNNSPATTPSNPPSPMPQGSPSTPSTSPTINLINPVPNDQWKLGAPNPIAWSQEAGVTGEIDLLNASTKALVGVILSETAAHQTSYSWDTRQVYLARYNPLKKDVVAGTYVLRIKFDGNNLPTLTSGLITIK